MNPPCNVLDYVGNGATTLALRETRRSNYGGSSLTFTGYTPVYATRGALSVLFTSNAITPTVPTGFTLRDATTGAGAFNTPNSADLLNYQSGGPVWTSLGVVGGYGGLLEFSGP
jgi:hypothetical protein